MTERTGTGELHQISAEIGGLKTAVDGLMRLWQMQENVATQGRQRLHEKFEQLQTEVRHELNALAGRVDRLSDAVKQIEPAVADFRKEKFESEQERLRKEGAQRLGGKLWSAMVLAAGALGWGIHEIVIWFRHP